jgi:hypothetical protein
VGRKDHASQGWSQSATCVLVKSLTLRETIVRSWRSSVAASKPSMVDKLLPALCVCGQQTPSVSDRTKRVRSSSLRMRKLVGNSSHPSAPEVRLRQRRSDFALGGRRRAADNVDLEFVTKSSKIVSQGTPFLIVFTRSKIKSKAKSATLCLHSQLRVLLASGLKTSWSLAWTF